MKGCFLAHQGLFVVHADFTVGEADNERGGCSRPLHVKSRYAGHVVGQVDGEVLLALRHTIRNMAHHAEEYPVQIVVQKQWLMKQREARTHTPSREMSALSYPSWPQRYSCRLEPGPPPASPARSHRQSLHRSVERANRASITVQRRAANSQRRVN